MTTITKIGNSRGVRIPKAIIKQANLENTEIEFKIGNEGLLLKPISNKPRKDFLKNHQHHTRPAPPITQPARWNSSNTYQQRTQNPKFQKLLIRQKPDFFYGKYYHKIKSRKHVHQSMPHRRIYQS